MSEPAITSAERLPVERLIVALDRPSVTGNRELVATLGEHAHWYKVGLATFSRRGPDFVRWLKGLGKRVFLDLKFHDIPATVAGASAAAAELDVQLFTVHAAGGADMMRAAANAVAGYGETRPKVLAVTVLTSAGGAVEDEVTRRAAQAQEAGCDGVICSPLEAAAVRRETGESFLIVTPGIRFADATADDQSRVATPSRAVSDGANHIVVGRPIHAAKDPVAAVERVLADLARPG